MRMFERCRAALLDGHSCTSWRGDSRYSGSWQNTHWSSGWAHFHFTNRAISSNEEMSSPAFSRHVYPTGIDTINVVMSSQWLVRRDRNS